MSLSVVKFDKQTRRLDPQEEMYWLHFLSRDSRDRQVQSYIQSQIKFNPQLRKELLNQPVCSKCEGFTFFHKGGAQCVACGHWTPESQTHSAREHIIGGHYR